MNPEPRIMTTAEPTLEQIAESHAPGYWQEFRLLARELLALRGRIERCDEWSVQHGQMIDGQLKRLTALERVQRDAEAGERDYLEEPLNAEDERQWLKDWRSGAFSSTSRDEFGWPIEMHGLARSVERWMERSEMLERKMQQAERTLTDTRANWNDTRKAIDMRVAERDALHGALLKYGKHTPACENNLGNRYPCTCGLSAALASATPAEGGEG